VAGIDLYDFFEDHVLGTKKPDWGKYLGYAGLSCRQWEEEVVQRGFSCIDSPEGPVVRFVTEDSAPARAGLRRGDRVLSIGGVEVSSAQVVNRELSGIRKGELVRVTVDRSGEGQDISWRVEMVPELRVEIGESPDATPSQMSIRRGFLTGTVDR